ncbi:MAG: phosphate-starvation-inducible PsiE family protein [Methanoregula sp.]|nr:phosphate-starvation-inducible PsiE family protein [Methanoregula sp.]
MIMLIVVLITSLADLTAIMYEALWVDSPYLLQSHELIAVLGAFLLVLIGIELLDTIKAYFIENTIHVEIVILLAIIAMARKVILLDPTFADPMAFGFELMGIGVIVVGLSAGYYLIKKAGLMTYTGKQKPE